MAVAASLQKKHLKDRPWRDTRSPVAKAFDALRGPEVAAMTVGVFAVGAWWAPALSDVALVFAGLFSAFCLTRKDEGYLVEAPVQERVGGKQGKGIFKIGNERETLREIWFSNDQARQHFMVLGTTGSGKAIPHSEGVFTPHGFRRLGDLRKGDLVCVPSGGTAAVTEVYEQGECLVYVLAFDDGREARGTHEHLWRCEVDGAVDDRTTDDVAAALTAGSTVRVRLPEAMDTYGRLTVDEVADVASGREAPGSETFAKALSGSIVERVAALDAVMDAGVARLPSTVAADVASCVRSLGGVAGLADAPDGAVTLTARHPAPASLGLDWATCEPWITVVSVTEDGDEECSCILIDDPEHLFVVGDHVPTHNTETLLGFCANALTWSSGFMFCDGKGDVALWGKVSALARRMCRDDDVLIMNMMGDAPGKKRSNTFNPYTLGTVDELVNMTISLMDDMGGDGAIWSARAEALLSALMGALVWQRDQGLVDLNVSTIRNHLALSKIQELADPRNNQGMPDKVREQLAKYLEDLPGYVPGKEKQHDTTLQQHGYLQMQFTKIFGSLSGVYGYIFDTQYGEVDMNDVVAGRRILLALLPALAKSKSEVQNLGKIIFSSMRSMMGDAIGSKVDGTWFSVIEKRPTTSPSPFPLILDEVGGYVTEGMDLAAAQGRSLGFSCLFAAQDLAAMSKNSDQIAKTILANTRIKMFLLTEDVDSTMKLAIDSGGKGWTVHSDSFDVRHGETHKYVREGQTYRLEERDRISQNDLRNLGPGEFFLTFTGEAPIQGQSFYANPEGSLPRKHRRLQLNHFVAVPRPDAEALRKIEALPAIAAKLHDAAFVDALARDAVAGMDAVSEPVDEIGTFAAAFEKVVAKSRTGVDASCAGCGAVVQFAADAGGGLYGGKLPGHGDLDLEHDPRSSGGFERRADPRDLSTHGAGGRPAGGARTTHDDLASLAPPRGGFAPDDDREEEPAFDEADDTTAVLDALDGFSDAPKAPVRVADVPHSVAVGSRAVSDHTALATDVVLRVLADLDVAPHEVSPAEMEERVMAHTGAPAGFDAEDGDPEDVRLSAEVASAHLDTSPSFEEPDDGSEDDGSDGPDAPPAEAPVEGTDGPDGASSVDGADGVVASGEGEGEAFDEFLMDLVEE